MPVKFKPDERKMKQRRERERERKLKGNKIEREKRLAGDKQEVNRVNIMQSEEKRYIQLQTKNIHQ